MSVACRPASSQSLARLHATSCGSQRGIVVGAYSDLDTIIGEDERSVRGCEFGVRHFDGLYG